MNIPAPLAWALKLVVSYFLDWAYDKMKMYKRLEDNKKERRAITDGLIAELTKAETEEEKREALDKIVRGGF
jgi:hypothetical protein